MHCNPIWANLPSLVSIMKSIFLKLCNHIDETTTRRPEELCLLSVSGAILLWCICAGMMTKEAARMELQCNNSRLIIQAINMDSILFHTAATEMIEFQELKLKRAILPVGWKCLCICVHMCRCVWTPSKQPPIVYVDLCNKGQSCGGGQRGGCVCVCVCVCVGVCVCVCVCVCVSVRVCSRQ